jgi:two-component system cell cycle sensor histidine kinase/response regulator CckA
LVVSDLVMPEMGGIALYQTLKRRWPEVRMLFVTGHPLDSQDHAILERGEVHWLQKPFSVHDFHMAVQQILHTPGFSRRKVTAPLE